MNEAFRIHLKAPARLTRQSRLEVIWQRQEETMPDHVHVALGSLPAGEAQADVKNATKNETKKRNHKRN